MRSCSALLLFVVGALAIARALRPDGDAAHAQLAFNYDTHIRPSSKVECQGSMNLVMQVSGVGAVLRSGRACLAAARRASWGRDL